ncbi:MAG: hypothetical protein RLZZ232_2261 [Planctomycetota bacterium]
MSRMPVGRILLLAGILVASSGLASCVAAVLPQAADNATTPSPSSKPVEESSVGSTGEMTLPELKQIGRQRSAYRRQQVREELVDSPQPDLAGFQANIQPILMKACVSCHGPETREGNIRIDTLNPDLVHGSDASWWLEVVAVLSNGEMPPAGEGDLADQDRSRVVDWLSSEIQRASAIRRTEQGHSSFRRMTRYEYNYALQDLLGLPWNFAGDLPPESASEDGFHNSSEMLHMSATQFATYRDLGLAALKKATVEGDQPPVLHWGVSMRSASTALWQKQNDELEQIRTQHQDNPEVQQRELQNRIKAFQNVPGGTHYRDLITGRMASASWDYGGARYARAPQPTAGPVPETSDAVAVIPRGQKLIVELGDRIPDEGTLRVRVRASAVTDSPAERPSLQLEFGWQASNDSQASVRISPQDLEIDAPPGQPRFYEWQIPLTEIHPRNSVRGVWKLGDLPSPSEYLRFVNSSVSQGAIEIDYVEVTAPWYEQWPPESHQRIFVDSVHKTNEVEYAREILTGFITRAWRRPAMPEEVAQKLSLFARIRPECRSFEEAMLEVLSTVLASPRFLYLLRTEDSDSTASGESVRPSRLSDFELATRLSMFLWCSIPDNELLQLAAENRLGSDDVLTSQVQRMLADPRAARFAEQFVRQWLGMQLLDYLKVDRKVYPRFDTSLKDAMQQEPVAFFEEVLAENHSVLDFLHADYVLVNERLAEHYGLAGVRGNEFRKVLLDQQSQRGGLLTQAGLLAMNSDGRDSHPLKRGIWVLKSVLNDPPPPPPPAVPIIDLADPEIAKLTLKQRMENHRSQPACFSCHSKIDPWGIAFENYDAVGSWRTDIGGQPVDAASLLFNSQQLNGVDGLKRFLLEHRQDQFVRALAHKLATWAIGRPLTFGDRSAVDQIATALRQQDDGLATLVTLIATSDLFRTR